MFAVLFALLFSACSDNGFSVVRDDPLQAEPDIAVSPSVVRFAPLPLGCAQVQTLRVENTGEGPLEVERTWLDASREDDGSGLGAWSVESVQASLLPGESQDFVLSFEPGFLGDAIADLVIDSDDPDEPQLLVPLAGSGYDPTWNMDLFSQSPPPIDVLWVIDNSGSMWQEKARVTREINEFFQWFVALDLDYHMGVIATDTVNPLHQGRLVGTPPYVTPDTLDPEATLAARIDVAGPELGDEAGLQAMQWALSEPLLSGANLGFYREEARLVVVFLSDEEEQSVFPASDYIAFLDTLKPSRDELFIGAIVGDRVDGCSGSCDGDPQDANQGDKYLDVAEAFDGFAESICTCDLAPALEQMGFESTWFLRSFPLSRVPGRADMLQVWVDSEDATGWTYDSAANAVNFDVALPLGSEVVVRYPVDLDCP